MSSKMFQRTAGDGMESKAITETTTDTKIILPKTKNTTKCHSTRLIELFPKGPIIVRPKKDAFSKNAKFIPYEPYAGAVRPILPADKKKNLKKSKNRMDINTLISQMSQIDTRPSEFKPRAKQNSLIEKTDSQEWTKETSDHIKEMELLKKENATLKDQVKQQVQVNKELKTMLVASMGEDLETQVQSLNDDKRHLANALLNSAQHLSTHQEQTEWLAGQCEVWRSKFLASSLMIEELAEWKRVLSQRTQELQQAIKQMLEERNRVREMELYTYKNLYSMHKSWLENILVSEYQDGRNFQRSVGSINLAASVPTTANLIDLASVNLKLSENIGSSYEKCDIGNIVKLSTDTEAERNAEQIMSQSIDIKRVSDGPVSALVSHAHRRSSTAARPVASCVHCNGRVQLL